MKNCKHNDSIVEVSNTNYVLQCSECGRRKLGITEPQEIKRWGYIILMIMSIIFSLTWYFKIGINL